MHTNRHEYKHMTHKWVIVSYSYYNHADLCLFGKDVRSGLGRAPRNLSTDYKPQRHEEHRDSDPSPLCSSCLCGLLERALCALVSLPFHCGFAALGPFVFIRG